MDITLRFRVTEISLDTEDEVTVLLSRTTPMGHQENLRVSLPARQGRCVTLGSNIDMKIRLDKE